MQQKSPEPSAGQGRISGFELVALLGLAAVLAWLALAQRGSVDSEVRMLREPGSNPAGAGTLSHRDEAAPSPTPLGGVGEIPAPRDLTAPLVGDAAAAAPTVTRPVSVVVVDDANHGVADVLVEVFKDVVLDVEALQADVAPHAGPPSAAERARIDALWRQALQDDPAWQAPLLSQRTRADGTAAFTAPVGPLLLLATRGTLESSGVQPLPAAEADTAAPQLRLKLAPCATLHVQVLDEFGGGLPGARVIFSRVGHGTSDERRSRLPHPVESGADGRVSLPVDDDFFASMHAESDEMKTPRSYAHASRRLSSEVVLRFAGAFGVTGVVLGPGDVPLSDVAVDVAGNEVQAEPALTDAEGRFRLDLAEPGSVPLKAASDAFLMAEPVVARLTTLAPFPEVTLRMLPPVAITGRLQWTDGTPIPGHSLMAIPTTPDLDDADVQAILAHSAHSARNALQDAFESQFMDIAQTDDEGRFRLERIHPDIAFDVRCIGGDSLPGDVTVKAVAPGTDDVLITYDRSNVGRNVLRGQVLDAWTHAPIPNYAITCSDWFMNSPMGFGGTTLTVSDAQGAFEFRHRDLEQAYGFEVQAVDYPAKTFGPFMPSADSRLELLVGRHASLTIVVTDGDGAPQPGARVQLMIEAGRSYRAIFSDVQARLTDADGLLLWPNVAPGVYSLEAVSGAGRSPRQAVTLGPGHPSVFELVVAESVGTGALALRTQRANGTPWPGAAVKVVQLVEDEAGTPGLEPVYVLETDAQGQLLLQGLAPGDYAIHVSGDDTVIPLGRVRIDAGATNTVTIAGGA